MSHLEVHAHVAALFIALLKNGQYEEARSFLEWVQEQLLDMDTSALEEHFGA